MAKFNKDTQNRINTITEEAELQKNMSGILTKKVGTYKKMSKFQKDLLVEMKGEKDIAGKLTKLQEKKEEIIKSTNKKVKENQVLLLKQLEDAESHLKSEEKRKTVTDQIKDSGKSIAKDMAGLLGISQELSSALLKGSLAIIAMVAIKEVAEVFVDMAKNAKETSLSMGVTGKEAMKLQSQVKFAQMSFEGMLLGSDKLNTAMTNIVEATGNVRIPDGMITDVAALSQYLDPKNAISLARTLKNAGQNTEELRGFAEKYAESVGGRGADGLAYLASNQLALVGLSEDQLKVKIQEGIQLKQMGADMDHLNQKAGEALDIESSLRNEMKLRAITGKEISMNALRAAQVSGDTKKIAEEEAKLIAQLGPQLKGNLQLQRMIGDATGLSKEQMLNYQNATAEAGDRLKENTKEAGMLNGMFDGMGGIVGGVLMAIAGLVTAMLALWGLSKLFSFFKLGNPVTEFIGDFGSKDVLMGAAAMVLVAGSMLLFAMAMGKFSEVMSVESVMATVVGMALLGGAMLVLALAVGNPATAGMLLMASGAMLVLAAAFLVFGYAIQAIAKGFGMLAELGTQIFELAMITPLFPIIGMGLMLLAGFLALAGIGLLFAAPGFLAFGIAMIPFAAGMALLGVALPLVAEGMKSFSDIVGDLPGIAAGLLLFGLSLIPLSLSIIPLGFGMMIATPGILGFAIAITILGAALKSISGGLDSLQTFVNIVPSLTQLVGLIPGLIALSGAFYLLSGSLMTMSLGLAAISFLIPTLAALGVLLPTVSAAINGESTSTDTESTPDDGASSMAEVVEEIKGLRQDIANQPILINVDGKVVSEITKVQARKLSTRGSVYGGGNK